MLRKIPGLNLPPDVRIGSSIKRSANAGEVTAFAEMLDARLIGLSRGGIQRESVFEDTEPVKAEDSRRNGSLFNVTVRSGSCAKGPGC
jgi:hypothetical protein